MLDKLEPLAAEFERDRKHHERELGEVRSVRRKALRAWFELNTQLLLWRSTRNYTF